MLTYTSNYTASVSWSHTPLSFFLPNVPVKEPSFIYTSNYIIFISWNHYDLVPFPIHRALNFPWCDLLGPIHDVDIQSHYNAACATHPQIT